MNKEVKVGAFVLETLTTGMYTNPLDSLREYIQNASDSIFAAERNEILAQNQGVITIKIDSQKRTLSVRDNGMGITTYDIHRLLNVGMSNKQYDKEAGFRGIGRLAGIAYCKRLTFTTTAPYEEEESVISFDCEKIRKSFSPTNKHIEELQHVLRDNVSQDLNACKKEEHYFEVKMEDIDHSVDDFLEVDVLDDYLSQVAPVGFDAQSFLFAPKIMSWARDNKIKIPQIKIIIEKHGNKREVFKAYRNRYKTKKKDYSIEIKDVSFWPEDDAKSSFWMWYGKTDLLGMVGDDKVAGLRFRRHNISIGGPERVDEIFPGKEDRLNYWLVGEIHILSEDIIPNARRDGFESNQSWLQLQKQLEPFVKQHCKSCHEASSDVNRPIAKLVSSAESLIQEVKSTNKLGYSSSQEKDEAVQRIEREMDRLTKAMPKRENIEEKKQIQSMLTSLNDLKKNIDNKGSYAITKIKSNLDRKQRKILIDILGIVNDSLLNVSCSKRKECLSAIKKAILAKYQVTEE